MTILPPPFDRMPPEYIAHVFEQAPDMCGQLFLALCEEHQRALVTIRQKTEQLRRQDDILNAQRELLQQAFEKLMITTTALADDEGVTRAPAALLQSEQELQALLSKLRGR